MTSAIQNNCHLNSNEDLTPPFSLFNKIINEKEYRCISIPNHIRERRYFLKSLLIQRFPSKEKPLAVEKLALGFQHEFFEDKSNPYYINPNLSEDNKLSVSQHYRSKIHIGELTYLSLKEMEPDLETKRKYLRQKQHLLTSQNFSIIKENSPTFISRAAQEVKTKSSSGFFDSNKHVIDMNHTSPFSSTQVNCFSSCCKKATRAIIRDKILNMKKKPPKLKASKRITTEYNETVMTSPRVTTHSYHNSTGNYKTPKKEILKCTKDFYAKVNQLSSNRSKNEKRLFKIIDRSKKKEEPMDPQIRIDLEQMFDIQLAKKATQGETKKAIMQALKLNKMKPLAMDETKMRMLELSDRINKLTDEEALLYAERIAEEYYKNNILLSNDGYKIGQMKTLDYKKVNELNQRKRLETNYIRIACLSNSLIQKNRQIKHKYEEKKKMAFMRKLKKTKV